MRTAGVLSFEDIISQATQAVHDRAGIEIPWSVMRAYANDAVKEFARRAECVRGQETIAFTASFTSQKIPTDVIRITKVSMTFNGWTGRILLDRCEERDAQAALTFTGRPTHWYVTDDLQSIALFPTPSDTGTLYIDAIMAGNDYVVTPQSVTTPGTVATTGGVLGLATRPDDWYNGCKVLVTSGTYNDISTTIQDYVSSTGACTFDFALPASLSTGTTLTVTDAPNTPPSFSPYLVQYAIFKSLQLLRPNDAAGALSAFERGVEECKALKNPKVGFRPKRVREFADVYEGF